MTPTAKTEVFAETKRNSQVWRKTSLDFSQNDHEASKICIQKLYNLLKITETLKSSLTEIY